MGAPITPLVALPQVFMRTMGSGGKPSADIASKAKQFDDWLVHTTCEQQGAERENALKDWETVSPFGRFVSGGSGCG